MRRMALLNRILPLLVLAVLSMPALAEKRGVKIEGKDPAAYIGAQYGKSWAVVIGINEYQHNIPKLRYAAADAQAIGQELEARGFTVIRVLDQQATAQRIRDVLGDQLPAKMKPEDRLVVFYAGHGETRSLSGGQTMGYLLPVDAQRDRLHGTAINMAEIRNLAALLPSKHVLFLVDVCYGGIAGQQFRSLPPQTESYLKQITREPGRQLITAGGPGQQVVEGPQWGHSVFTYFLLKGLKDGLADLNQDGVIPASELYAYLDGRVPAESEGQQRPELWSLSSDKGEFVFLTSATNAPAAPAQAGARPADEVAVMKKRMEEIERKLAEQANAAQVPQSVEMARARPYDGPVKLQREVVGRDGATMVLIPKGEFLYGKDNQRKFLPAFYIDKFETSRKHYAAFLEATNREEPEAWREATLPNDDDRPVVGVTWDDADAYCRHYSKRLPTEQEWEKAARGTDGRKYPWGNEEPNQSLASYAWNGQRTWQGYSTLAPVESYEAGKSPYGVYNMIGNVVEWTSSISDKNANSRVMRGSSWIDIKEDLAIPFGVGYPIGDRLKTLGFRCAMNAT